MNTIIISQNDKKVRKNKNLKRTAERDIKIDGKPISYRLKVEFTPPDDPQKIGGMLAGSPNRIKNSILKFADDLAKNDTTHDLIEFQVVFIYHQTHKKTVRRIFKAMDLLSKDRNWTGLPKKYNKAIHVKSVWLLSCESGANKTTTDEMKNGNPGYKFYADQANHMIAIADKAFTTVFLQRNFKPSVRTFSTGNPETGGTTLDPWDVKFKELPGHFTPNGGWEYEPTPQGENEEVFHGGTTTSGKVFAYDNGTTTPTNIPANGALNIMGYPAP